MTRDDFVDALKASIESGYDIQEGAKTLETKSGSLIVELKDGSGFLLSTIQVSAETINVLKEGVI